MVDISWTDLQARVVDYILASDGNTIAQPERLSTDPLSPAPLQIYDAPLFGVADAADPLWQKLKDPDVVGPHHLSPGEWLPGARSVISYFLPFTKSVRLANRVKQVTATEWLYGRYEGQIFNVAIAKFVVAAIEAAGGRAMAPAVDPCFAIIERRSNWSERHAGFVSGLGTFSLNRSIITRAGSAGRLGSVITDVVIAPTLRAYQGITEYCEKCGICIDRCPCQAIDETGKNNQVCSDYLDENLAIYKPRYGCGKCQTAVPCEHQIPPHQAD